MKNDLMKHARLWRVGLFLGNAALVILSVWTLPSVVVDSVRTWPWPGTEILVWPMWGTVVTIFVLHPLGSVVDGMGDAAIRLVVWFADWRHK